MAKSTSYRTLVKKGAFGEGLEWFAYKFGKDSIGMQTAILSLLSDRKVALESKKRWIEFATGWTFPEGKITKKVKKDLLDNI
jgi:hypothetical protein